MGKILKIREWFLVVFEKIKHFYAHFCLKFNSGKSDLVLRGHNTKKTISTRLQDYSPQNQKNIHLLSIKTLKKTQLLNLTVSHQTFRVGLVSPPSKAKIIILLLLCSLFEYNHLYLLRAGPNCQRHCGQRQGRNNYFFFLKKFIQVKNIRLISNKI